jgi:V8-like Glu-specific endopeptidase
MRRKKFPKARTASRLIVCMTVMGVCHQALAAQPAVAIDGATATFTPSDTEAANEKIDYARARPAPLPIDRTYTAARAKADLVRALTTGLRLPGPQGGEAGRGGTGEQTPVILVSAGQETSKQRPAPRDYGTSGLPFSTARVDLANLKLTSQYPYSAVGKLFYLEGSTSYVCSAALIKRGVIVTAAHCAAKFGTNTFYKSWRFAPGYSNGLAPYGTWTVAQARV